MKIFWELYIELQLFQVLRLPANWYNKEHFNLTFYVYDNKLNTAMLEFRWYHECTLRPKIDKVCFFIGGKYDR